MSKGLKLGTAALALGLFFSPTDLETLVSYSAANARSFKQIYKQFESGPVPIVGGSVSYKNDNVDIDAPAFGIINTDTCAGNQGVEVKKYWSGCRKVTTFYGKSYQGRENHEYKLVDFLAGYLLVNSWEPEDTNSQFIYCLYHDVQKTVFCKFVSYKKDSPEHIQEVEFARSIGVGKPFILDVAEKGAELAGFDISGVYSSLLNKGIEKIMEYEPKKD